MLTEVSIVGTIYTSWTLSHNLANVIWVIVTSKSISILEMIQYKGLDLTPKWNTDIFSLSNY